MTENTDNNDEWQFRDENEEQTAEEAFANAARAIEAGQSVSQALEAQNLPEHIKQKLRKRLQQVALEREMRDHEMAAETREKSQGKSGLGKLFSMSMLSGVISRETIEKVQMLFSQQPNLQQEITKQGQQMLRSGVEPDVQFQQGNQLPAPAAGVGQGKGKSQEQGR